MGRAFAGEITAKSSEYASFRALHCHTTRIAFPNRDLVCNQTRPSDARPLRAARAEPA